MKPTLTLALLLLPGCAERFAPSAAPSPHAAPSGTATRPAVLLPPLAEYPLAAELLTNSPFGINTAFNPDTPDLEARLSAMQQAGIKWGRQDFTWRRIERAKGVYDWSGYDRLVELCHKHGVLLFGNLAYAPPFHDPRTPEGVQAYADLARAAAMRYRGKVDHWQIWNEPNGGFWKGTPEQYATLLAASGKAIHEVSPDAKVLGLNMAFCDVIWAERILRQVPYDCFDIACFHPYRPPSAPEEKFDWWELDQYVKSWHKHDLTPDYPLVRMSYLEQAEELVKVMARFGPAKPMWVTEICWNTHIHPYGTSELRQADLLVRFYVLSIASRKVGNVFWWTLKDGGERQFDQADMVGLMRHDLTPKYAYQAFGVMSRMLEGRKHVRNDSWGPVIYAATFRDEKSNQDTIVAWATKPYAYVRLNNTAAVTVTDIYGVRREVAYDRVRTGSVPVPLGESPVYITGPAGLRSSPRADPGW
jgi:hypothetical protein